MRPIRFALILLALLAFACTPARAQNLQMPGGSVIQGCTWSVTTFGGAAPQSSNVACLAGFSHVAVFGPNSGSTWTAVVTPEQAATTPQLRVNCAITAAGSTTVSCLAPAGQATTIVTGFAW